MGKVVAIKQTVKTRPSSRVQIAPDRPSRSEAEDAVRTLIRWAGDNPSRPGMVGTPARVVRAYEEWFSGYAQDPREYLSQTFDEVAGYDEVIVLRDISFESHCEHHLAPIIGRVHIGYLPRNRVVGISKLARLVDVYAKRFQNQEKTLIPARLQPLVLLIAIVAHTTHILFYGGTQWLDHQTLRSYLSTSC